MLHPFGAIVTTTFASPLHFPPVTIFHRHHHVRAHVAEAQEKKARFVKKLQRISFNNLHSTPGTGWGWVGAWTTKTKACCQMYRKWVMK